MMVVLMRVIGGMTVRLQTIGGSLLLAIKY